MSFPSFWGLKSSWEVRGTLVPNQRFYHEQHLLLTWKCVPCVVIHLLKFWSSISWKTITKGSKSGFSTKSSQIEHFTRRVLYRKKIWKTWFGIHVFHSFWQVKYSWEVWGTLVPNQKVLPRLALLLTWKCVPYVACLVIHLLKFWSSISWKTITKGSKSGFSTKSSQIEHFTWRAYKEKTMKNLVWDSCLFLLFGRWNPSEKYGEP